MILLVVVFLYSAMFESIAFARTDRGYFSLYDSGDIKFNRNALLYKDFNRSYGESGSYRFNNFTKIQDYDGHPVMLVFQPQERVNELSGYFFQDGIYSLFYYGRKDNPTYKNIRDYFDGTTEAVTPHAARSAYPYFYDYPLLNVDNSEKVASNFAVIFAAPKSRRVKGVDQNFIEIIRNNFYKDPFETYEVFYLEYGRDFCPYMAQNDDRLCALGKRRKKKTTYWQ